MSTAEAEAPAANVIEALSRVMRDLPAIPKDHKADQKMGGYPFRRIDDVYNVLQGLLARHGVVYLPTVLHDSEQSYSTKGGASMRLVKVRVQYRFYGPGGIEDHVDAVVNGEAGDTGDKATSKAQTMALKYLLIHALCIAVEDLAASDTDGTTHELDRPAPDAGSAVDLDAERAWRETLQALNHEQYQSVMRAYRQANGEKPFGAMSPELREQWLDYARKARSGKP